MFNINKRLFVFLRFESEEESGSSVQFLNFSLTFSLGMYIDDLSLSLSFISNFLFSSVFYFTASALSICSSIYRLYYTSMYINISAVYYLIFSVPSQSSILFSLLSPFFSFLLHCGTFIF